MKRVRDFHSQSWDNPFFERAGVNSRAAIFGSVVFIAVVSALVYTLIYSPFLRIEQVTINESSTADQIEIKAAAMQTVAGYEYFFIPKDHYFFINTIGVKNFLMARFPNMLTVDVQKGFGGLALAVVERQPTYRLIIGDKSYLLDQEGKGMREAVGNEGDKLIALSNEGAGFTAGKQMSRSEWLQAVNELHKYFATQVGIRDRLFKLDTINSYIEAITAEGWSAIFDPQTDIQAQLKTLSSALAGKFSAADRKKLLYIDARFGDKIFYKANQ